MSHPRPRSLRSCPSAEELAALLDGRVVGEDRQRLLAHVEGCDDCFEIFSESARYLAREEPAAEVAGTESTQPVVAFPAQSPARAANDNHWRFALAAVLAIVLVGGLLWLVLTNHEAPTATTQIATTTATDTLPIELPSVWPQAGSASLTVFEPPAVAGFATRVASEEQRAFRQGVYGLDLELALRSGNRDMAKEALLRLMQLAEVERALEPILERLLQATGPSSQATGPSSQATGPSSQAILTKIAEQLDTPFDWRRDWLRFGRWTELGRLACAAGAAEPLLVPDFSQHLDAWIDATEAQGETTLVEELNRLGTLLAEPITDESALRRLGKSFERILLLGGYSG